MWRISSSTSACGFEVSLARVPMFFSASDAEAERELFRDAGLAILLDETVVQSEPEGDLPFHWMLAQKSKA
jgi:hypothetical protein